MNSYNFVINYPIPIRWNVALFGRVYGKRKFNRYPTTHTNILYSGMTGKGFRLLETATVPSLQQTGTRS